MGKGLMIVALVLILLLLRMCILGVRAERKEIAENGFSTTSDSEDVVTIFIGVSAIIIFALMLVGFITKMILVGEPVRIETIELTKVELALEVLEEEYADNEHSSTKYYYFATGVDDDITVHTVSMSETKLRTLKKGEPRIEVYEQQLKSRFAKFMLGKTKGYQSYRLLVPEDSEKVWYAKTKGESDDKDDKEEKEEE